MVFESLESRSLLAPLANVGTASDIVFNLPTNASTVILEDDGIAGNGISQLRSTNGSFDTTTFVNPTGSLTIGSGNAADTLAVGALPDFIAGLNLGTVTHLFGTISFIGGIALSAGNDVSAQAGTLSVAASGAVSVSGGGGIDLTADSFDLNLAATLNAATGAVNIAPLSSGRSMNLGTKNSGELSLTDAEIGRITAGTINVGNTSSGPIMISAGLTLAGKNLTLVTGAGVSGSAAIVNGSATPVAVTIDQAGNSTFSGVLGGPAAGTANAKNLAVTKLGAGTLTLTGTNTYTGTTLVGSGVLLVNGSVVSNVTVNGGATLGGTGIVGRVETAVVTGITLNSGGHLAPGAGGPGILRSVFTKFASGSSFDSLLNGTALGTQYSQLVATSGSSLNGATLQVTLGFTPAAGRMFTILKNSNVTGTFDGLPEGQVFTTSTGPFTATFQITYRGGNGNDVVLTAIDPANPILQFPASGGDWQVKHSNANVVVSLEGTTIFSPPFASLSSLTISALYSDHSLTAR